MIDQWLEWARGPIFLCCFLIFVLGIVRQLGMTLFGLYTAIRRAANKSVPYKAVFIRQLKWLIPFGHLNRQSRPIYSVTSLLFHVGVILTPLFLGAHIMLFERGFGFGWISLNQELADGLTILTIVTGIGLFFGRVLSRRSRPISRLQDIVLVPLLVVPFFMGFMAMHPEINPMPYNLTILIHIMSGNLILFLVPFTKLSHMVIVPFTQLVAEVGWHFPGDSAKNVAIALNKEDEKI